MISFEDFKKIDLRVAKILSAEEIEGAEKLLKLQIDLGGETRQIVSGIKESHKPEDLVGKEIIVVANLEPRVLKGVESQGMLLAAHDEQGFPVLLSLDKNVPPGSVIS
ncbi:MAG: methionine--tRNA ligase subunit beta [Patescibacteria group bacterium]